MSTKANSVSGVSDTGEQVVQLARQLCKRVGRLRFSDPVTHIYNPLDYARVSHDMYVERYARSKPKALLLGMNPGPFGMAQTGVPFGEVGYARDWLKLEAPVGKPKQEHPKRPVIGFECTRSEVSGRRIWSWAEERYKTPKKFFQTFFVWNYCPLVFMEEGGKNRTPDKLSVEERDALYKVCDQALVDLVSILQPKQIIGVGRFAQTRAVKALEETDHANLDVGTILHPSPASPMANRGWAPQAERQLLELGIRIPGVTK